jgi:hypothetical protein
MISGMGDNFARYRQDRRDSKPWPPNRARWGEEQMETLRRHCDDTPGREPRNPYSPPADISLERALTERTAP